MYLADRLVSKKSDIFKSPRQRKKRLKELAPKMKTVHWYIFHVSVSGPQGAKRTVQLEENKIQKKKKERKKSTWKNFPGKSA